MPSMSSLATNSALTAVENTITNVNNLVTKTDVNTKIPDIDKYITTPEVNKLTTENFKARLAQANLITKADPETEL